MLEAASLRKTHVLWEERMSSRKHRRLSYRTKIFVLADWEAFHAWIR